MTEFTDEELRAGLARAGKATDALVDPDTLWAAARGEGDAEQRAALIDRLPADPVLREEWRIAQAFAAESEADDESSAPAAFQDDAPVASAAEGDAEPANSGQYRWWLMLGAAAAVVAVVLLLRPRDDAGERDDARQMRGDAEGPIEARTDGEVAGSGDVLRWSPVPGAKSYAVTVTTESLDPVFTDEKIVDAEVAFTVEAPLPSGTTLLWRVDAQMEDGTTIRSGTFTVRVR